MEMGLDVLVEKPMAKTVAEADALLESAKRYRRVLQIGHVERFNPAVLAVEPILNHPLFFEVHRLGVFTPRSLDVDVIYDLMIHDLDILLALVKQPVTEVKAVGIPVLTDKVDIAHARLEFEGGAVANVTASRISTERVRKVRFFQQHEYISLDYARRDALRVAVKKAGPQPEFAFEKLPAASVEPLRAELESFVEAVRTRTEPRVNGVAGRAALELAARVMASIQEHGERVQLVAFAAAQKTEK
jgi:predicted dehydrogenase